jgi:uncharacterized protein
MRRLILALILSAAAIMAAGGLGPGARAQEPEGAGAAVDSGKARDIERLLRAMRAGELGIQMVEEVMPQIMGMFEMSLAAVPGVRRDMARRILEEEMRKEFQPEKLITALVPIYDRLLSAEDVKALLAFWESPAGARYAAVQPQILKESSAAGDTLALAVATRAVQRMADEGVYTPAPRRPTRRPPARRRRN